MTATSTPVIQGRTQVTIATNPGPMLTTDVSQVKAYAKPTKLDPTHITAAFLWLGTWSSDSRIQHSLTRLVIQTTREKFHICWISTIIVT
jgi:hypothetical protein